MNIRIHPAVLIYFIFIIFSGCSHQKDEPLKIVRAYNEAVIYAHKTGDTSRLTEVAGDREARIISILIDTKRAAGLVLESTLEDIKVINVEKINSNSMIITTSERWRYYDRPLKPGKSLGPVIKAFMKVKYECGKIDGKWKVMKIAVLEHTNEG